MQNIKLSELSDIVGGQLIGNGDVTINGVCSIDNPQPHTIALALEPSKIGWQQSDMRPAALIVKNPVDIEGVSILTHGNPRLAFTLALRYFNPEEDVEPGIHSDACVSPDAKVDSTSFVGPYAVIEPGAVIGPRASIGAGCYVGARSVIGGSTKLYPNVTVLHDVKIGERCIVNSGAVIGSEGFGYTPANGINLKVPQVGRVEIGDDVEIGAGTTIDRATLDATRIGDDVKLDNLVQVAHNVKIGPHTRIAAQVGISGRVIIEENVVIAGQAGFQNGIRVGEGSIVGGQAGVTRHVSPGSRVSGYPARDHKYALQLLAAQNRLPELVDRMEKIESKLGLGNRK